MQHIAINQNSVGYESRDLMTFNTKLNLINPAVFPKLSEDVCPPNSKTKLTYGMEKALQAKIDQRLCVVLTVES